MLDMYENIQVQRLIEALHDTAADIAGLVASPMTTIMINGADVAEGFAPVNGREAYAAVASFLAGACEGYPPALDFCISNDPIYATFSMATLPGCPDIVVVYGTHVSIKGQNKGIERELQKLQLEIAKIAHYAMMLFVGTQDDPAELLSFVREDWGASRVFEEHRTQEPLTSLMRAGPYYLMTKDVWEDGEGWDEEEQQ